MLVKFSALLVFNTWRLAGSVPLDTEPVRFPAGTEVSVALGTEPVRLPAGTEVRAALGTEPVRLPAGTEVKALLGTEPVSWPAGMLVRLTALLVFNTCKLAGRAAA